MNNARIGGPIAVMVLGAIVYFALNVNTQYANLKLIGLIAIAAGAVWLLLELLTKRRKPVEATSRQVVDDGRGGQHVVDSESRVD